MKNYLFIPYEPIDSEVFQLGESDKVLAEFRRRARATSAKCTLFAFDPEPRRGLRLLYSVSDGEISDGAGRKIGQL